MGQLRNDKHLSLALLLLSMAVVVSGCATQIGIATTHFNTRDYKNARIILLPTVINPSYSAGDLPVSEIERVVAGQFSPYLGSKPEIFSALNTFPRISPHFPYTPKQLAKIGSDLKYDGAVGISVASYKEHATDDRSVIDLVISFADTNTPESKNWVLSGTWSAASPKALPKAIGEIGLHFVDVKWLAFAGARPWGKAAVFSADQPLITISGGAGPLRNEMKVSAKSIALIVGAIYDGRIAEVEISNVSANSTTLLFGAGNLPSNLAPTFIFSPISVPLISGKNTIVATATSANGVASKRQIVVFSTVSTKLHVASVGVSQYSELPNPLAVSAAIKRIDNATAKNSKVDASKSLGPSVSRLDVSHLTQSLARAAGSDDPSLIFVSARASVASTASATEAARAESSPESEGTRIIDSVVIQMSDTSNEFPGLGSVDLKDFVSFNPTGKRITLLDLCADAETYSAVRSNLRDSLAAGSAAVLRKCDDKSVALAALAADALDDPVGVRSARFGWELLNEIAKEIPTAVVILPALEDKNQKNR
jgi:hypothetical protein